MKRTRFLNNTKLNLLFFQFDEGHWPGLVQGLGRVQPYSLQRRSQLPEACRRSQLELYRIVPRSSPRFPSSSASRFTYTGNNSIKFLFRLKNKSLRSFLRITFGKILVVYTCFFEVRMHHCDVILRVLHLLAACKMMSWQCYFAWVATTKN